MKTRFAVPKKLLLLATLPLLASCARMTATAETNGAPVCAVWPYVSWSVKDTDKTIADAKLNNARRDGWCKTAR